MQTWEQSNQFLHARTWKEVWYLGDRVERFGDIGKMIGQLEMLYEDDKEWKVEEGNRRGCRRLRRRISELLRVFGEGGDSGMVRHKIG